MAVGVGMCDCVPQIYVNVINYPCPDVSAGFADLYS